MLNEEVSYYMAYIDFNGSGDGNHPKEMMNPSYFEYKWEYLIFTKLVNNTH